MRLQYFARPSKNSGEIRYSLAEGSLWVECPGSGRTDRLELSQVREVRMTTWHREGCCELVSRGGQRITIPSYSCTDSGLREDQVEEYTGFIDSLHEHLEILAPEAKYEGKSSHLILSGILTIGISVLLGSIFGMYFLASGHIGLGVGYYRWFLLTFGILAACGLIIGAAIFRKGLPRSYKPGMPPCYLLPVSKEPRVSVGTEAGLPANIQFYGHQHKIFPMTEDRRRKSPFNHMVQRR